MEYGSNETTQYLLSDNTTHFSTDSNSTLPSNESLIIVILKGGVMVAIMSGAAFGNSLVILSVFKYKRLRGITSYFIVSLAFADFLVATSVMPFNASMELSGRWIFGRALCDIYNANDVLFSTASILHLCCISMDRYIAITKPLQYEAKMTKKKVIIMLCVTWGASALISYIPIHSQIYASKESKIIMAENHHLCLFLVNKYYAGISTCVSFLTPAVIMIFVYSKIFKEAKRQEKQIKAMQKLMVPLRPVQVSHRNNSMDSTGNNSNGSYHVTPDDTSADNENTLVLNNRQDRKKMRREHKAAKTLGIIMGAFIACWLPFFLWYFISAMCGNSCVNSDLLVSILFWIGYFNSSLNPMIYAFFNREFRNAFRALLGCKRKRHHLYNGYDITGYVSENPNTTHPSKNPHKR